MSSLASAELMDTDTLREGDAYHITIRSSPPVPIPKGLYGVPLADLNEVIRDINRDGLLKFYGDRK